jgi:hypothetical protein
MKLPIPTSKLQRNFKLQTVARKVWTLVIGASLDVGAWGLVLDGLVPVER